MHASTVAQPLDFVTTATEIQILLLEGLSAIEIPTVMLFLMPKVNFQPLYSLGMLFSIFGVL